MDTERTEPISADFVMGYLHEALLYMQTAKSNDVVQEQVERCKALIEAYWSQKYA